MRPIAADGAVIDGDGAGLGLGGSVGQVESDVGVGGGVDWGAAGGGMRRRRAAAAAFRLPPSFPHEDDAFHTIMQWLYHKIPEETRRGSGDKGEAEGGA